MIVCVIVLSDDDSRVILTEIRGVLGSDYINASFITVRMYHSFNEFLPQINSFRDIMGTIILPPKVYQFYNLHITISNFFRSTKRNSL